MTNGSITTADLSINGGMVAGPRARRYMLLGTALGSSLVMMTAPAQAQNVSSTNNTSDYTLTETGTRSGGPRTIDVATSGGNLLVDVGTVNSDNNATNNPNGAVTGAGIAARNTGPGTVTVRVADVRAAGPNLSYGIDARATTGAINITSTGTVTATGNNGDTGIIALSGGGDVLINANVVNGERRGIFVGGNGGTFGDTGTTTVNSTNVTANGTGLVNAIVAQGYRVVVNSGTASNTNAAGNQGTAIFANASAGGVLLTAGTTTAFGVNQAAMQVFSEGAVDVTSGVVRTTNNSDGISIASGTDVVVRSGSVTLENGGRGIILGGNAGGGGFNSGPNGFAYNSATVTSDTITTAGANAYGIYATPNGSGSTTINSGSITTTGNGATGIFVAPIGTGVISGPVTINSTGTITTGAALGINVSNSSGKVTINNSGAIASGFSGIAVSTLAGDVAITSNAITTTANGASGIIVQPGGNNATVGTIAIVNNGALKTTGANATGINAFGRAGPISITNNGSVTTTGANSYGLSVNSTGGATISGTGSINSASVGVLVGNNGRISGPVSIQTGAITTTDANGTGVQVTNVDGAVSVGTGAITAPGVNASGIFVSGSAGPIAITATDVKAGSTYAGIYAQQNTGGTGPITVQAQSVQAAGAGINVFGGSATSPVTVNVGTVTGGAGGVFATSGGAVAITAGTTESTGANSTGLTASSTGAAASVTSTTLTSGARGIFVQGLNDATVTSGSVTSGGNNTAIIAQTVTNPTSGGAAGVVRVDSNSIVSGGGGIAAYGPRADVIVNSGTVVASGAANFGVAANGVNVTLNSGSVTMTNGNAVDGRFANGSTAQGTSTITSGTIALNGTDTGTTGAILATNNVVDVTSGTITNTGTGNRYGIAAQALQSGTAGTTNPGTATVRSGSITTVGDGAYGMQVITDAGALTVNSTGTITTAGTTRTAGTQPRYSAGIIAVSGSGPVSITSNNITTGGAQSDGIRVEAGSGIVSYGASANPGAAPVSVTTTGLTQTGGASANGVNVLGGGGAVTVANSGTITTAGADAFGVTVNGGAGAVTITSNEVRTSGNGSGGITAATTTGAITINAGTTVTTGAFDGNTNGTDAITGFASGAGNVSLTSGTASAAGQFASAVFGSSNGGTVTVTSGTATTSGASGTAVGAVARTAGDAIVTAINTTATGQGATAVSANAAAGNATVVAGTASSTGTAVSATAGKLATATATSASASGDGASAVRAIGGTGVALNVGNASSAGTATSTTNPRTGVVTVTRADAVYAAATTGTINAAIGSATATGAGADAVRLIANGTGGAVTAAITGRLNSTSGTGLFIDPPGDVTVTVAPGASITGLNGINTTGATNTITNQGSIAGTGGAGILASGATALTNSGSISGANDVAVQLGSTNDTVTLLTGSSVIGRIVGGGGTDVAILSGTGAVTTPAQTVAGFTGFDTLTVQNGYWTALAGNGSAFNSVTTNSGATLDVANGATGLAVIAPSYIDNGALVVRSSGASAGSTFGASTVTGSGTVLFTGAGTATLDGTNSIQSTGTVTIDGGSTVLVTGTQGGTFVTGSTGTLQLGTGGTTGSFTGSLADNGTLVVNRSDTYTFAGALTGAGNIVKQGAGQLVFGSGYAFTGVTTIQGGSIRLTTPVAANTEIDLEGAGQLDLSGTTQRIAELAGGSAAASLNIAGGSLTDVQNTNTTFAGSITGAGGSLTKSGTGRLNLTGTNTYTGPTTVNGGTLAVNGSIVSAVTVASGGTLGGTGSVGSVTVGSGGTYAPGNSIGTQTVNGNVTFAAGSVFAVEANSAGQADRINATGTATLQGGTVAVTPVAGSYGNLTNYTILTAGGGVTGTFASTTSADASLTPFLSYGPNSVTLTLARNNVAFGAMGTTPNQAAVGTAITALGVASGIYRALLPLSASSAAASLGNLSGELYASLPAALADGSKQVREAVLARAETPGDGIGVWATGTRTLAGSRSQAGIAPVIDNRWTAIGGIDFSLAGLRVGIDGGYIEDETRIRRQGSQARTNTTLVGGHAGYAMGPVSVVIGGDYAWHDINASRSLGTPGLAAGTLANTRAHTVQGYGEVGYGLTEGDLTILPFVRFSYVHIVSDAFMETGGLGALTATRDERNYKFGSVGVRMSGEATVGNGLTFLPRATIAYTHGGDIGGGRTLAFAGATPQFSVTGAALGRDALDVNVGFDLGLGQRFTIGAGGFGSTSREWSDYGVKASIGFKF